MARRRVLNENFSVRSSLLAGHIASIALNQQAELIFRIGDFQQGLDGTIRIEWLPGVVAISRRGTANGIDHGIDRADARLNEGLFLKQQHDRG
jgi:hypothetical protein